MDKRKFLKIGLTGIAGLVSLKGFAGTVSTKKSKVFVNPSLNYEFSDMKPYLSKQNLDEHFKYQVSYTNRLNKLIKVEDIYPQSVRQMMKNASDYNYNIINVCGGYLNHKIYLKGLSNHKNFEPVGLLKKRLEMDFGSYKNFKSEFENAALSLKQNGWAWLVIQNGKLKIVITKNNENPLMNILPQSHRGKPILTIDLWKHAYITDYPSLSEYIEAHWNMLDWQILERRYLNQSS